MAVANCIVTSKIQGKGLEISTKTASEGTFASCPHPPYESVSKEVEPAAEAERGSLEKLPDEILTQVGNAAWLYPHTTHRFRPYHCPRWLCLLPLRFSFTRWIRLTYYKSLGACTVSGKKTTGT